MFIDAHHHLWDLASVDYPWLRQKGVSRFFGDPSPIQKDYLTSDFREDIGGQFCVGSVHVQVGVAPCDEVAETEWLDHQSRQTGLPSAIVAAADLRDSGLSDRIDAHLDASERVRGIRQIVSRHPSEDGPKDGAALLKDPAFQSGLQVLSDRGLSFDLQLTPPLLPLAADILSDFPDLSIVLCHAGSPWDQSEHGLRDWSKGLERLANRFRTTCKISGLGMFDPNWDPDSIAPIVETVLSTFGPCRTMWGSNFPVDKLYHDYISMLNTVRSLVPRTAREAVFVNTAANVYQLGDVAQSRRPALQ
ncbi:MAG: amidohydrolase family protein [Litorimonas sp.]